MNIVQTYWLRDQRPESSPMLNQAGWLNPEYHWFSWALSSHLLHKQYGKVHLFTNELGKKVLVDLLDLPYTKVTIIDEATIDRYPANLWVSAKAHTYGLQSDPFVHIDGDAYLWQKLPELLTKQPVFAQNREACSIMYEAGLQYATRALYGTDAIDFSKLNATISLNAGIIGGVNTHFFNYFWRVFLDIAVQNYKLLSGSFPASVNMVMEQLLLYQLANTHDIPVAYLKDQTVTDPAYPTYYDFKNVPHCQLIHPVGAAKRLPDVCHQLGLRLRNDFPSVYYHVIRQCLQHEIPIQYKLYYVYGFPPYHKKNTNFKPHQEQLIDNQIINSANWKNSEQARLNYEMSYEDMRKLYKANIRHHQRIDELFLTNEIIMNTYLQINPENWFVESVSDATMSTLTDSSSEKEQIIDDSVLLIPNELSLTIDEFRLDVLNQLLVDFFSTRNTVSKCLTNLNSYFDLQNDTDRQEYHSLIINRLKELLHWHVLIFC
jgi:hypothetical protein